MKPHRPLQNIQLHYFNLTRTFYRLSKEEAINKLSFEACPDDRMKRYQFKRSLRALVLNH